jgi:copper chaperone CopZ
MIKKMKIPDMNTQKDVDKISEVLQDVWGIRQVEISLPTKEVVLTYDEKAASCIDFREALDQSGFEARDLDASF